MTPLREAIVLPLLLLTSALLASVRPGAAVMFVPPSPYALVLAVLLVAALVRSGALDPVRLMHGTRPALANANGAVVAAALLAAAAAVLTMIEPDNGLPRLFVALFLPVLLINTLVAQPDRVRLLRSLAVIVGAGVAIKFVVLAGLSEPSSSTTGRVLVALFDAATFGAVTQGPQPGSAGYLALAASGLFLVGAALLPRRRPPVTAASAMQRREA